jgi:hypothetical protein
MSCYGVYVMAHDDDVRVVSSPEESHQGYSTDPQKIHTQDTGYRTTQPRRREARGEKKKERQGRFPLPGQTRPSSPLFDLGFPALTSIPSHLFRISERSHIVIAIVIPHFSGRV